MALQPDDITHALSALRQNPETPIKDLLATAATIVTKKRFVAPKTPTQKAYIEAIETYDIVIGIGPAGTGKTYLAMAINALLN
ncbi:MAG: PhoH family protein [Nitrospiraceae bacterium]